MREQPTNWLVGNKTGRTRLHVGLPPDWRVGDRPVRANGERHRPVWPPQRQPVLVTRTEGRCNGTIAARSEVRWRGVGGVALSERPAISLKRQLGGNQ